MRDGQGGKDKNNKISAKKKQKKKILQLQYREMAKR